MAEQVTKMAGRVCEKVSLRRYSLTGCRLVILAEGFCQSRQILSDRECDLGRQVADRSDGEKQGTRRIPWRTADGNRRSLQKFDHLLGMKAVVGGVHIDDQIGRRDDVRRIRGTS